MLTSLFLSFLPYSIHLRSESFDFLPQPNDVAPDPSHLIVTAPRTNRGADSSNDCTCRYERVPEIAELARCGVCCTFEDSVPVDGLLLGGRWACSGSKDGLEAETRHSDSWLVVSLLLWIFLAGGWMVDVSLEIQISPVFENSKSSRDVAVVLSSC
jgi:hypothetical protein